MSKKVKLLSAVLMIITLGGILMGCNKVIKPDENTAFRILQITDVHIKNNEKKDKKAFNAIIDMVKTAEPDMIIVTGDITSEHDNLTAIKTFGEFMENEIKLPWSFVYGNHDTEGEIGKTEVSEYLESLEYCMFEKGDTDTDGEGNYYYNVKDKSGKVIQSLIMMDSNMYNPDKDAGGYDKFHDNQIVWYEKTIKDIALEVNGDENMKVPSLAFFHIPMTEFVTAYDEAKKDKKILYGKRREKECHGYAEDLMFEKMLELGSTKGVFVGHDHMNNYSVEYKGIRLTYGNSCDHNIYIVPRRGGCLINIKNDGSFTTQAIYRPRLSSTFKVEKEI